MSTAALGALLLLAGGLEAQQPTAAVPIALASPVLPDIAAVERVTNGRQQLQFVRLSNQRASAASVNGAQLDWRPVAEQGRSWFAYVASDENRNLALMLDFVDDAGELATMAPIRIPFGGQVSTPRWSRDGKHLAFVSDSSILYIVSDVGSALRGGTAGTLRPTRVSAASTPARFPAWSPLGDQIAYGTEVVSEGVRNGAIEVLPINRSTGEATGVPVVVTGELGDDDEYRPSWSRDAKYIAFYADSTGTGSERPRVSIGIVEVVLNPRTGQSYRGIVKEGSQRWLADNVIADSARGPAWTSITEAGQRTDAVVYVKRDALLGDPLMFADFPRWLAQLPRNQYETAMSSASDEVSPRSVSSLEINKRMRFVFTLANDGKAVSYRDVAAPWAEGPEPTPVVVATAPAVVPETVATPKAEVAVRIRMHKGQDVGRALLFPGLGQLSAGRRAAAAVLAIAGAGGATTGIIGKLSMGAPLTEGKAAVDAINRDPKSLAAETAHYNKAKSDYQAQRGRALLGAGVFVASWLYGIIDASTGSGGGSNVSLKEFPDRDASGRSRMNVGFSFPMGR
ncbi:MAG: hypothetical protein ABI664_04945 [bacterium]